MEPKDNNQWREMTKQLIIRSAECILDNKFPEIKEQHAKNSENPLKFSFNEQFVGKFGLNKEVDSSPDLGKIGIPDKLTIIFFLKSPSGNNTPRRDPHSQSKAHGGQKKEWKTIETWNISFDINAEHFEQSDSLVSAYNDILKQVTEKSSGSPAHKYVNKMFEKYEQYMYMFNYRLQYKQELPKNSEVSLKTQTQEGEVVTAQKGKFDISFGDIVSLNNPEGDDSYLNDENLMVEYFSEKEESIDSSREITNKVNQDDSDEFVLITSSGKFNESAHENPKGSFNIKVVSPRDQTPSQEEKEGLKVEKRESEDTDGYEFDSEALFKDKAHPLTKFKLSFNDEQQRMRCYSDTTACSRFKNILSGLKTQDSEVSIPKVFQKQQFEYKNCISPSVMDNFVINESHFVEENNSDNSTAGKSRNNDGFEDDDFNPFKFQMLGNSVASGSQNEDPKENCPSFKGLREFRISIDATNDFPGTSRPISNKAPKISKHRKFTLSFDENSKRPTMQTDGDFFIKFDEETAPEAHLSKFKGKKEEETSDKDASFEFSIAEDYFSDDLAGFDTKNQPDSNEEKGNKGTMKPTSTDRNTRDSTQGSQIILKTPWLNHINSNNDSSLCIYQLERIRRRLERNIQKNKCLLPTDLAEEGHSQTPSKSVRSSDLKETMVTNYMEIIDFRNKINESNFDLIL